ncbi:glucose-1-phosphate adenylyltransferase subunit GlgD [Macrococcus carouselicus]|uniref:Glucose-1-phosphate adenylyltransferase subunit GlgD n=1 Tax=Macrococcus carouselicus TaxID=69969 RepID=A0A9Q8FRD5_9STAP|nr:glucose-1-phosphate adenylyltransferase subunit GlgD [Macrococcus carouselicus]TDM03964.1 glucose-1-phosphate adenylyltransferase subunit GlgD [Macrococcus carouselicus]
MRSLMGLINLENEHDFLEELTYFRNGASVPFAGRYRLIDFSISNMVNSGVDELALFVNQKYRSLLDHLENGEHFGLNDKHSRLFVLPPDWHDPTDISRGDLRHFHNNHDFFSRSKATDVIISGSQFIANVNYKDAYKYHVESDADITLIAENKDQLQEMHGPVLRINEESGKVTFLNHEQSNQHLFTGVYIIKKEKLMDIISFCIDNYKDTFFLHGIQERLDELNVRFYDVSTRSFYINSLKTFYHSNMAVLDPEIYKELFMQECRVRTKTSNQPPTKYLDDCVVKNAIVANGCVIDGCVENSILYRGAQVAKGAVIKNSIIMTNSRIGENVVLENVILDKDVTINDGQHLRGSGDKPFVVAKRQTI